MFLRELVKEESHVLVPAGHEREWFLLMISEENYLCTAAWPLTSGGTPPCGGSLPFSPQLQATAPQLGSQGAQALSGWLPGHLPTHLLLPIHGGVCDTQQ